MIDSKEIANPFPGLRPFETDEYRLFFGREGQSDALIARLQRSHFLAVVGTSGSGKSSLVRAGLLPALRGGMMAGAGSGWRIAIMRPGSDPFGNLAGALAEKEVVPEAGGGLPPAEAEAVIEATLRRGSLGLVDAARQARLNEHEKLLVVVDQFEELFRFRAVRAPASTGDDASAFVKLLLEAAQQRELSIFVVPTMRSDFLGDCAQFQGLPEAINEGQYLIPRMTRDERRFAITGPIGVKRRKITEPLVNRLMNDVGDNPDQLPILQHALMRTWDYWSTHRRDGEPIGLEHYEAIGTMSDALSEHADEAWTELDERGRLIAERLFKALTERGADNREIRRPTSLSAICEIAGASLPEVAAVIEVFRGGGRSFLMPPAGVALRPETVIDISHESLIRNWRRLQVWVNEEAQSARIYRRLAEAAVLHHEGGEGFLQDPGLQIALDWREKSRPTAAWAERYHPEFAEAISYLGASRDSRDAAIVERERQRQQEIERDRRELEQAQIYAEQQRRAAQRMRRFTLALVLISLFALAGAGAAVVAFARSRKSESQARLSESQAKASEALARNLAGDLRRATDEANRQRDVAISARQAAEDEKKRVLAAEKKEEAASLDAQQKARVAEQERVKAEREKLRAEEETIKNRKARETNDRFRDGVAAAQRGEYRNAEDQLTTAIKGYLDRQVANEEAVADTNVELGNLRFGLDGDVNTSVGYFDQAAQSYSRRGFLDKAIAARVQLGNLLLGYAQNPQQYYKGDSSCPERERASNLSYLPPSGTCLGSPPIPPPDPAGSKSLGIEQYKLAFDLYRQKNDHAGMTDMAYRVGDLLGNSEMQYDKTEAIKYFNELLKLYSKDEQVGRVLLRMAGLNFSTGNERGAQDYLNRVFKLFEGVEITNTEFNEIGDTLENAGQPERALDFYRKALTDYQARGNVGMQAEALYSMGVGYEKTTDYKSAKDAYRRTIDIYKRYKQQQDADSSLPSIEFASGQLEKITSFAVNVSDYPLALDAAQTWLAFSLGRRFDAARAYGEIGRVYALQQQPEHALESYNQAKTEYGHAREWANHISNETQIKEIDAALYEINRIADSLVLLIEQRKKGESPTPKP